jgi:cell division protein FtsQ
MNAAVRGSSVSRRKPAPKSVSKRIAARLPAHTAEANRLARGVFALFVVAVIVVAAIALDLPAKAGNALGDGLGRAGFAVDGYQIVGLNKMKRSLVDEVVTDELHRAADAGTAGAKPAEALVDVDAISSGFSSSAGSRTPGSRAACPTGWSSTSSSAHRPRCGRIISNSR